MGFRMLESGILWDLDGGLELDSSFFLLFLNRGGRVVGYSLMFAN